MLSYYSKVGIRYTADILQYTSCFLMYKADLPGTA